MTKTMIEQLERKIDDLIRAHIADVRRKTAAAVERAFASSGVKASPAKPAKGRNPGRRRGSDELKELSALLYKVVCANPGATMATLAKSAGKKSEDLEHPAKLLKRLGKIRSVGERNATRYFPLASKSV